MATPVKITSNMTKHLTVAERRTRQAAERGLKPGKRPTLKAPAWLPAEARKIFEVTKRKAREYAVLEAIDVDLLALYCQAVDQARKSQEPRDAQSWSRIALSYAEKLGISAAGRARLAKKKAEGTAPDELEQLLSDVTDYVNAGQDDVR